MPPPPLRVTERPCVQTTWCNAHFGSKFRSKSHHWLYFKHVLLFSFISHLFNQLKHNPHRLICWFIYLITFNLKHIQAGSRTVPQSHIIHHNTLTASTKLPVWLHSRAHTQQQITEINWRLHWISASRQMHPWGSEQVWQSKKRAAQ